MSPQRDPWTGKDTAQCVFMLGGSAFGLAAFTGHMKIDQLHAYAQAAAALAVPVAIGIGAAVLAVGVLLVLMRHLRAVLVAMVRAYWLYRRHWARVLEDLGLTETKGEQIKVPQIQSVSRHDHEDMVIVRMLPGQSAAFYHERSAALAAEFGASSARVRFGEVPHRDVVIVFDRRPAPRKEQLALPAPQPHPLPLYLPTEQQHKAGPQMAIQLSGLRLQIVWARAHRATGDGSRVRVPLSQRYGLRGELRWCTAWTATATAN
jgi:hypothetical protein